MKILVYEWNGFCQQDLRDALRTLGHQAERIGYVIREKCGDSFFEEQLSKRLKQGYDCMMTFNFFPSVAKCCHDAGVPYLSWIYDGEDFGLYHDSVYMDTNYVFTFDSRMMEKLKKKGMRRVWYLPLGVNVRRLEQIHYTKKDYEQFGAEISFVGNLYQNKPSLDGYPYPPYLKGYLEGIIRAQEQINTCCFLEEMLTAELVEQLMQCIPAMDQRYTIQDRDMVLSLLLTCVTKRERFRVMAALSEAYPVDLYTYSRTDNLPKVRNKGTVGYFSGMPQVFRCSKINLNITHRMIQAGIPLRVMDVLGAGGFLMSNYQQDMGEEFRDGEHLAVYYSPEDLKEKAGFYLQHDAERNRIARQGHELVKQEHTMEKHIQEMLCRTGLA